MYEAEPNFEEDLEESQEALVNALNELTNVKAYTLAFDEVEDFKIAQYALRNLIEEYHSDHDLEVVQK